ncbi:MAG: GYD domain-containing protein [Candidatus Omnitrophica bacterium]|nr:GYD domain-containing protein [Candidatus Omnitrophota bacterium]
MATYYMFGKYSQDAVQGISADRTKEAVSVIKKLGGKVNSMHVLLGRYDLVLVVTLPSAEKVVKASIELARLTGIGFTTSEAIPVEKFDKLTGE